MHRSFNAAAVGIDRDHEIKIRHWGRATYIEKPVDETEEKKNDPDSLFWLAPELIQGQCEFNPNLDVWSIGMLALYIANGTLPFLGPDEEPDQQELLFKILKH